MISLNYLHFNTCSFELNITAFCINCIENIEYHIFKAGE
jgi:hypothetical protein